MRKLFISLRESVFSPHRFLVDFILITISRELIIINAFIPLSLAASFWYTAIRLADGSLDADLGRG